ncbi:MAG: FAD-dependent oxidoreductase [Cyclobacteriaceae bacterium]
MFDCIVVGKGLIGSAAAKYLKKTFEYVAVIGPDEPLHDLEKAQVFASHYDQSRVQRIIGVDPVWTQLNKQSAAHYPKLEKETGISFHSSEGCLYVSPYGKDRYLKNAPDQANQFRLPYQFFENEEFIHKAFQDYTFPAGSFGMLEPAPAGHINPLQLIKAQLKVFQNNGGEIYNDTVVELSHHNNLFSVNTATGQTHSAKKVLVTAGAFSNFFGLLPQALDLELESETVLLAEVSESEAKRLSHLPSLLYELDTEAVEGIYLVQPVQYPDGRYRLKMGCNLSTDIPFQNLNQIQEWFRNGDSLGNEIVLRKALHAIIPTLNTIGYTTKKCIVSRTRHGQCYIGPTAQRNLYVAAGGNGYSAMCSEALGQVATHYTIHEDVPPEYSAQSFKPIVV